MTPLATTPAVRISADEFFRQPNWERCELVDGELVEMPEMSGQGCMIAVILSAFLHPFVRGRNLGVVFDSETTFQCFGVDSDRIRRPDLSFIAKGRLPREQFLYGHIRIAPDIAVEIVSPNDEYTNVDGKIEEYIQAGVRLVWVVNPDYETVTVWRPDWSNQRLHKADVLTGETVLPEFSLPVAELFPNPDDIL